MKAIVRDRYGLAEVLKLEQIEQPVPKDDEVLIRMRASSLNRGDRYVIEGIPLPFRFVTGVFGPKQRGLGMDFAGEIADIGGDVTDVGPGDEVYGEIDFGATWAEYACVPAALVAPKPSNLSYEQAGAVGVSGLTALQGLRDAAGVQPGQSVLLNGSTGAVGTFAVQIAKALGAEVTAVCSERNVDLVEKLGADHVIAYERDNFLNCGRKFDVLFDIVGNHSVFACRTVMKPDGVFAVVGGSDGRWLGPIPHLMGTMVSAPFISQRVVSFTGTPNRADMNKLTDWIESGALTPAIDRSFPLEQAAEALTYLTDGHPASKVVLTMNA